MGLGSVTIGGDLFSSVAELRVTNAPGAYVVNVNGNFDVTGGVVNLIGNSAATIIMTVAGNTTTSGSSKIQMKNVNNAAGAAIFQT